jgi:hypothetical protein
VVQAIVELGTADLDSEDLDVDAIAEDEARVMLGAQSGRARGPEPRRFHDFTTR